MIPFVVTGMPRSSTKWTAELLTAANLPCTHETTFDRWNAVWARVSHAEQGDASWIATPFIDQLRAKGVPTVRIVRHPMDVVSSLCGTAVPGFRQGKRAAFMAWVDRHVPLDDSEPDHVRALRWWVGWNQIGTPDLTLPAPIDQAGLKQVRKLLGNRQRKWPAVEPVNAWDNNPQFGWDDFTAHPDLAAAAVELWTSVAHEAGL